MLWKNYGISFLGICTNPVSCYLSFFHRLQVTTFSQPIIYFQKISLRAFYTPAPMSFEFPLYPAMIFSLFYPCRNVPNVTSCLTVLNRSTIVGLVGRDSAWTAPQRNDLSQRGAGGLSLSVFVMTAFHQKKRKVGAIFSLC